MKKPEDDCGYEKLENEVNKLSRKNGTSEGCKKLIEDKIKELKQKAVKQSEAAREKTTQLIEKF